MQYSRVAPMQRFLEGAPVQGALQGRQHQRADHADGGGFGGGGNAGVDAPSTAPISPPPESGGATRTAFWMKVNCSVAGGILPGLSSAQTMM